MSTPTAQPASQIIQDALLELGVIRVGQTPSAAQQATGVRKLNEMMALWEAEGRRLGYVPVGTATAVLTVPDAAIVGIRTNLAIFMAPSFGASASPELIALADMGLSTVQKICVQEIPISTDLPPSSDTGSGYDIRIG